MPRCRFRTGFELNVFASEEMFPDLANPVQMQVDSQGSAVGRLLEHLSQVGTAQGDERQPDDP